MTTIAGITLSDHLVLGGLENAPDIAYSQNRTLMGLSVLQAAPFLGGKTLTLAGENILTKGQIFEIKAIASTGTSVILDHPRGVFEVVIVNTEVEPAFECVNPSDDDWYSGTITMIEV